jgi:hypothetical protein
MFAQFKSILHHFIFYSGEFHHLVKIKFSLVSKIGFMHNLLFFEFNLDKIKKHLNRNWQLFLIRNLMLLLKCLKLEISLLKPHFFRENTFDAYRYFIIAYKFFL